MSVLEYNEHEGPVLNLENVKFDKLTCFLRNHGKSISKVWAYGDEIEVDEWLDGYYDSVLDSEEELNDAGFCSIADLIAGIMTEETGIRFTPSDEMCYEDEDYCSLSSRVTLINTSPWKFRKIEKDLTPESLMKIMKKYADELEK